MEILKLALQVAAVVFVGVMGARIADGQRRVAASQKDIAYGQMQIAEAKLKFDLFKQRYELFHATWGFLSSASQGHPKDSMHPHFTNLFPQAAFLMGDKVEAYMREASSKMTELALINIRTERGGDVMAPEDIDRHVALSSWFFDEASTGVRKVFGPFLDFSDWKGPIKALL